MASRPDYESTHVRDRSAGASAARGQDTERPGLPAGEVGQADDAQAGAHRRLEVPLKIYGREREMSSLMATFSRVAEGSREVMLVEGYSGIGKSSLVREIHKPVVEQGAHFISLKNDQYTNQDIPHSSLVQAFRKIFWQMTAEGPEVISIWKQKLAEKLGSNGKVIAETIPELELIAGVQPAVPDLQPGEALKRFNTVFLKLVSCLATDEHPLVIFLDDMQWADPPSLELIERLLTDPGTSHLLVIGAYRDNLVDANHHLMKKLQELRSASVPMATITIKPLSIDFVNALISETLSMSQAECRHLSEACFEKTEGNPFFLKEFLQTLHDRRLMTFDPGSSRWIWDIESIQRMQVADNVIDLLTAKMGTLSPESQNIIRIAACIGSRFDVKTLSMASDRTIQETIPALQEALLMGLILPLDESGQEGPTQRDLMPWTTLKFLHDRVMQAAYALIPEDGRTDVHLKIGRQLLESSIKEQDQSRTFEIVDQLNKGRGLMNSLEERVLAAELNLEAGKRARASMDHQTALDYIRAGMWFLAEDSWETGYELTCALYVERAECEYLNMRFDEAEHFLSELLKHVRTKAEKAQALFRKTTLYASMGRHKSATIEGLKGLRLVGVSLNLKPWRARVRLELTRIRRLLRKRPPSELTDLPVMTDPNALMLMDFMAKLLDSAFFTSQELWIMMIARMVRMSFRFGYCDVSAFAFHSLGMILGSGLGDYETGHELGRAAISLCEKTKNPLISGKVFGVFGGLVNHWRKPLDASIEYTRQGMERSLEAGDFAFAGYSSVSLLYCLTARGADLSSVMDTCSELTEFLTRIKSGSILNMHVTSGFISNLQGKAKMPFSFGSEAFDESDLYRVRNPQILFWFYLQKCHLYLLFEKYEEAEAMMKGARDHIAGAFGMPHHPDYCLFSSLLLAHDFQSASYLGKRSRISRLKRNLRKLKAWADNCPGNWLQKYLLVSAEMERIMHSEQKAMGLYDQAIEHARQNGFVQDEALAAELAFRFHSARGKDKIAQNYLKDAWNAYTRWGATRKARHMEIMNPGLQAKGEGRDALVPEDPAGGQVSMANTPFQRFDMSSILKSYRAISGELVYTSLLEKLMQVVVENAGAQEGHLILKEADGYVIGAHIRANGGQQVTFPSVPLEKGTGLSQGIVYYVDRTHENVVLDDAVNEGAFIWDPYVMNHKPRSILCIPIKRNNALMGMLYLENRGMTGAFTMDRVEVLQLLTSQIAISVDNARLYHDLSTSEERYRTIIEDIEDAYVEFDLEGGIAFFNRGFSAMTGYSPAELGGMRAEALFDAENLEKVGRAFEIVLETGASEKLFECEMTVKELARKHIQLSIALIRDKQGRAAGFRCVGRDVTVKRMAELQLQRAKEEAEGASRAKSEFLANVSHEIRTPLNAIVGFSELASKGEQANGYVREIRKASSSLLDIVNDILDFSEMENGRFSLVEEEFRVRDIMDAVREKLAWKAREKGIGFTVKEDEPVPETLVGDRERLAQVLVNLTDNGIKFTEQGSVEVRVRVERRLDDRTVLMFSVSDTGYGIPEEKIPALFNAFIQGDGSLTRRHGGTGLGLAISKEIVEMMGGTIQVESGQGLGSTFTFSVGFRLARASEAKGPAQPGDGLNGIHVLVVEDNQINQEVLLEILRHHHIEPDTAINGVEAVSKARANDYDAILMDIQMPVMDGYQATRILREDPRSADLPIIAVTAHVMDEDRQKCVGAGMNDYLAKPINTGKLIATLAKWVKPRQQATGTASSGGNGDGKAGAPVSVLPENIPGIDVQEALERMTGNTGMFLDIVRSFALSYADAGVRIRKALEEGDTATARELVHAVTGVAANISANDLRASAQELENCIREGRTDRYAELSSLFERSLHNVIQSAGWLEQAADEGREGIVHDTGAGRRALESA
ncbi:MAG TPA: AAA family ATPase [Deltaproteobacteria bacterium]|nr:AAA family ATPase [Deltaproteobacteria bacterium]